MCLVTLQGEDGRGQHKHSHSPLTPDALRPPLRDRQPVRITLGSIFFLPTPMQLLTCESDHLLLCLCRRWSPLSEQTHALSFRH